MCSHFLPQRVPCPATEDRNAWAGPRARWPARAGAGLAGLGLSPAAASGSTHTGWSTYDTFFGGRGISSAIKHSRMDEAAQAADNADRHLTVLRTELADVEPATRATASLEMDGLTRFADIWFDNIFTDLAVRDRIKQAQQNVARCVRMVSDVQARLAKRDDQARASLTVIERERRKLLGQ